MIESIVVNNKVYFFFKCCFPKFCFPENDTSVFGTEKAFVLCDLWVTDSCYKNTRIVNCTTGNHPVFLGSLIFQFTKDKSTLSRFALEMMEIDSSISHLKKRLAPTWMNQSTTASKSWFLKQLYYVRHLRQRDEKKNLMGYSVKQNAVYRKEIAPITISWKIYTVIRQAHFWSDRKSLRRFLWLVFEIPKGKVWK